MDKKLDYVDALRGIAILGVILIHSSIQFGMTGMFSKIFGLGAKGVQLFYFISAFTLFLSFNNRKHLEYFPNTNFFIRRFFRIAPLYYFAIIYYSLQLLFLEETWISLKELLFNFTFTHGFSPLYINHLVPGGWSIAIEMSFYIMVPFLMSKINTINKAVVFVFISLFIRFIFLQYFKLNPISSDLAINNNYLYWFLPNQIPCFSIGILFYFISSDYRITEINKLKNNFRIIGIALLVSLLCVLDQILLHWDFFSWDFLFCLGFFILAIGLSNNKLSFLVNKLTTICGKYSYSMYITHFIALFWINKLELKLDITFNTTIFNFVIYYMLVISITLFLSMITFKLIEMPTQMLGKNIINAKEKKQVAKVNSI